MTAATVTLPTPVITTPSSPYADMKGRSRKAVYTMAEGAAVIVTCSYNKGRKQFQTSVQPVSIDRERGFEVTKFMAFSGFTCGAVPQARFSAKALEEYTAQSLANVATMVEQSPAVAALFADPVAASEQMFPKGAS